MLIAFLAYLTGVFFLGWFAHRLLSGGSFIKEYFLGSRRLGAWVLAISFAATAISGGSFMGFPSLIYSKGWVMALWIASYMVVPLVTMAVLGKRINQASRLSGAVTIPDLLRDRYESPALGILTSLVLIIFLGWNLVAQFKAGGNLMIEALGSLPVFEGWAASPEPVSFLGLPIRRGYLLGLSVFVAMVVAYTTYGGFWGVTLTDVFQGLVMLGGALILAVLAWGKAGGLEQATRTILEEDPLLVYGPGPGEYLPFALAVAFFFQWTIIGMGQPGQLVRLMSFRDTKSLRRALCVCAIYYALIYTSLLVIFICARALYPPAALEGRESDQIMPFMISKLAAPLSPVLAGFLIAAPYAAIMSTVAAYLLIISSSLVRDIFQRFINPQISNRALRLLSYTVTLLVGAIAFAGALQPPKYLQTLIVYSTAGLGIALLAPVSLGLFWRRASRAGALSGMAGSVACFVLLDLWGFDPLLPSLALSFVLVIAVSLATKPASAAAERRYFFE
jgi:sodium/pantothenate symporter